MELQKPMKCVLSLGRFGFDKSLVRNKITFSGSSENGGQSRQSDSDKKNKFSSRMKISQSCSNYIDILKNTSRKPVMGSHQLNSSNECEPTLSHVPVYHKVVNHLQNIAITDSDGDFIYEDVFRRSCRLGKEIVSALKGEKIDQKICVLCPNGLSFVVAQWATWMTGNIFVPLSKNHSISALEYFVKDSKASLIIGTEASSEKLNELSKTMDVPLLLLDKTWTSNPVSEFEEPIDCDIFDMLFYAERHTALLLYGTNGKPGSPTGMLYRHYNLNAQADGMAQMWDLDEKSSVLNALPTNKTYGIINSLLAPLSVGGRVVMMDKFDPIKAWAYLLGVAYNGEKNKYPRTTADVLPLSPELYTILYHQYHVLFMNPKQKEFVYNRCRKAVRLMLCNDEPLPTGLAEQWREITGHSILNTFSQPQANGCHPSYVRLLNGKRRSSVA